MKIYETSRVVSLATVLVTGSSLADPLPLSDPENEGGWVLNTEMSDEFNADKVDREKWFIEGENGGDYYIWKGRPPSQFAEHNVFQEEGMLKIRSQWEPDFQFAQESYADGAQNDSYGVWEGKPMPVTTGGIISKERFLYGYMEVRTKAGNAAMTSSFWAIGYESELDIYEQIGNPKNKKNDIHEDMWKSSIHDWSPPAKRPTRRFGHKQKLPFRVADEFHVYAAEWGEDYLKFYLDGKVVYETTRKEQGKNWVLNNPLEIWFDSEIFTWLGLPHKEELPVDYEIDYLRVWQKPSKNLLAPQLFGFEGPILFTENKIPLELVPESSEINEYQKFWEIGEHAWGNFEMGKERSTKGIKSLKFTPKGMLANLSIVSPAKSVAIPAGEFTYHMDVFLEPDCGVQYLNVSLADPEVKLTPIDLTKLEKGKWTTVQATFKRDQPSGDFDRVRLRIEKKGVADGKEGALFIDNINIVSGKVEAPQVDQDAVFATGLAGIPSWAHAEINKVEAIVSALSDEHREEIFDAIAERVKGVAEVASMKDGGASAEKVKAKNFEVWSGFVNRMREILGEEQFEKYDADRRKGQ